MSDKKELSETETNEILTKLSGKGAAFTNYYKYVFSYDYSDENYAISISVGGSSDDIYKHMVTPISTEEIGSDVNKMKDIYPAFSVTRKSDSAVFEHWDY